MCVTLLWYYLYHFNAIFSKVHHLADVKILNIFYINNIHRDQFNRIILCFSMLKIETLCILYLKANALYYTWITYTNFRAIFTKFLTPRLNHELCNPLDDWSDRLIPTNHRIDCIIRRLIRDLKNWWIRALKIFKHLTDMRTHENKLTDRQRNLDYKLFLTLFENLKLMHNS